MIGALGVIWASCGDEPSEDEYAVLREADVLQFLPDDAVMPQNRESAAVRCSPLTVSLGRQIPICSRLYGTEMTIDDIRAMYQEYAETNAYRLVFDGRQGQRSLRWLMNFTDERFAWDVRIRDPLSPSTDENLSKAAWVVNVRIQLLEQDDDEE